MKEEKKAKVLSFILTDEKSLVPILHNLCTVIKLALMRRGKSSFCIRLELESIGKASVWKLRSSIFESWEKMHWLFVGKWRIIFSMNHSLYSWRGDITWILSPKILAVLAYFDDNLFAWWVSFFFQPSLHCCTPQARITHWDNFRRLTKSGFLPQCERWNSYTRPHDAWNTSSGSSRKKC